MKTDYQWPVSDVQLAMIGMMIFVAFFVGVTWWAYRKSGKKQYEYMEQLPLTDGAKQ